MLKFIAAGMVFAACGPNVTIRGKLSPDHVRTVSYNVYWDNPSPEHTWQERQPLVGDVLSSIDADLVGLQETVVRKGAPRNQLEDIVATLPHHEEVAMVTKRSDGYEVYDSLILFRRDRFELLNVDHFWMSTTPDVAFTDDFPREDGDPAYGPRTMTCLRLFDRTLSSEIVFCNTHWDGVVTIGEWSADLVVSRVKTLSDGWRIPVIMTGDFNTLPYTYDRWPTSPAWAPPVRSWAYEIMTEDLRDGYGELHPDNRVPSGCGWSAECPDWGIDARIDWLLHSDGLHTVTSTIIDTLVMGQRPSDHLPLVEDLELVR